MQAPGHQASCHLTLIIIKDFGAREAWVQITSIPFPGSVTLGR